jgi:diguanylate cyclase (GGDEF)-like protein
MMASSGAEHGHGRSESPRDRSARERDEAASARDAVSDRRDEVADDRDRAAERRDVAGDERDQSGAADRTSAGLDRSAAAGDRQAGRFERGHAEADRAAASADRDVSAADREAAHLDELTGAYRRGPGFRELEREMLRAQRERWPLVVAFVDVDHLKQVNDSHGHAAGDHLLQQVAGALRAGRRAYDVVIRYGGDEFVAVMAGLTADAATARLESINDVLRTTSSGASVSVGVADLRPGDSLTDLVRRADEALYQARSARD